MRLVSFVFMLLVGCGWCLYGGYYMGMNNQPARRSMEPQIVRLKKIELMTERLREFSEGINVAIMLMQSEINQEQQMGQAMDVGVNADYIVGVIDRQTKAIDAEIKHLIRELRYS